VAAAAVATAVPAAAVAIAVVKVELVPVAPAKVVRRSAPARRAHRARVAPHPVRRN